jgi:hypothetical protein
MNVGTLFALDILKQITHVSSRFFSYVGTLFDLKLFVMNLTKYGLGFILYNFFHGSLWSPCSAHKEIGKERSVFLEKNVFRFLDLFSIQNYASIQSQGDND